MSEAAASQPSPELPQTLEGLAALLGDLAAENRALFEEAVRISRGPMSQDDRNAVIMLVHRAADVEGIERAILDRLNQEVRLRTVQELWERANVPEPAPVPAVPPRRRRRSGSHRAHNPDQPPLWGLPSLVPAAAVAFRPVAAMVRHSGHALRGPLGHLQAAHHAAAAWTTAGAVAVGGAAVIAVSVVPSGPPANASGPYPGTARAPSGISASATPAAPPSRSARARPGLDVKAAGTDGTDGSLPGSYAPPGDGPPAQDPPPVQVTGTLQVSTSGLNLGVAYVGQVVITAAGGPVSWGAVRGSDAIALDSVHGELAAGQSATLGVTVSVAAQLLGGSATLRIWPGNIVVTVSWPALPVPVPLPTDLPPLPDVLPSVSVP